MVLVCGDSATDQIIEMKRLDSPHVHTGTIKIHKSSAFAEQLYQIIENYFNLYPSNDQSIKPPFVQYYSSKSLSFTVSEWIMQKVDDKERLFFNEHIGTEKPEGEDEDEGSYSKIEINISKKKIAAVCDIYNTDENYYYNVLKEFEWIVVRTLLQEKEPSRLLSRLIGDKQNLNKTIVILHSADLRKAGFEIKKGVSWEQLITETYEIISGEPWNKFSFLIICFEHEGALIIDNNNKNYTAIFYPNEIEGDYLKNRQKVFGMLNTLHATIIAHLCNHVINEDNIMSTLVKASKAGIIAMRKLINNGFKLDNVKKNEYQYPYDVINENIHENIDNALDNSGIIDLQFKKINNGITILDEICKKRGIDINTLCENIIERGVKKALVDIPVLKYEKLLSADCNEIKIYRKIHNLLESYIKNNEVYKKPLSICVFGSPGTGKSFGITEIINHINKDQRSKTQTFTFNLSQFREDDLLFAFNQISNVNLMGILPIVFWDEFDCDLNDQKLGWLKRFLVPMQDGNYYENGNTYYIGRAIFIFAGGIYKSSKEIIKDSEKNTKYKLPDFLSRIAGNYLDIFSLNQEERELKSTSKGNEMYKIRRAVIIRKLTEKYLNKIHEDYELGKSNKEKLIKLLDREFYDFGIRTIENEIIDLFVNNA